MSPQHGNGSNEQATGATLFDFGDPKDIGAAGNTEGNASNNDDGIA